MSILHILSRPPSDHTCWNDCLSACAEGDSLLLIESAVYGALSRPAHLAKNVEFLALQADIDARGLDSNAVQATVVTDREFVQLCVKNSQTISWF